jgi:hypothetical protein
MPRITLESSITEELSKGNALSISGTEASNNNNNMPSNDKAPVS